MTFELRIRKSQLQPLEHVMKNILYNLTNTGYIEIGTERNGEWPSSRDFVNAWQNRDWNL